MVKGRTILREADCVKKFHDGKVILIFPLNFFLHCFTSFQVLIQKYILQEEN